MMQFIQDLHEARLFRYQDSFDGKRISDMSTALYLMLLMIEVLRRYDDKYAVHYCQQTYTLGNFDGIRSYATDTHNLIAVLNNERYQKKMLQDKRIFVPEFALRRYFRDVMWGSREHFFNRSFFIQLSTDLAVSDSGVKTARRNIIDYSDVTQQVYWDTAERINRKLNDFAFNTDIQWYYKTEVRQHIPHS
jgi:hypothetical protein